MEKRPNWREIVEKHQEQVLRIAVRILGSLHDAEDVAQDVFVEAYQLHRRGGVDGWTGLLVRMATLRAIDRLRRARSARALCDDDRATDEGPFEEAVARELAERLRGAVTQLPDQQAAVFTLAAFEQLSRGEIAASLQISPQAVSTALYKARQQLMSELNVLDQGERS
ncbi:MAG TPA: sigma-70 family RNA polymerase sigma factor [Pirellulales bacterium]|jgi:RNA polymerase sigma-70 factor (ECF subfamily)